MQHKVIPLDFTSIVSEGWSSLPDIANLKKQLATLALVHSELHDVELGLYIPPKEIREVRITAAAADQIRCMWHGPRCVIRYLPRPFRSGSLFLVQGRISKVRGRVSKSILVWTTGKSSERVK